MSGSTGYFNLTLPNGGEEGATLNAEFISCAEAAGPFEILTEQGDRMFMAAGISYIAPVGKTYGRLRIINKTAGANPILLSFGSGEMRDARLTVTGQLQVVNPVGQSLSVTQSDTYLPRARHGNLLSGFAAVSCPAGVASLILGNNPSRKTAWLKNLGTETVYICGTVADVLGEYLAAGECAKVESPQTIYIYNPNSFTINVARSQEAW